MQDYKPAPNALQDRIILITGAGDGIGRSAAKACATHGATVILLGRTLRKLETVYDEIEQMGAPQPAIYPLNLESASQNDYEKLAETLTSEFGHLDGLLHNAGMLGSLTPLAHYDINQWYQVMQVNLNSAFIVTQMCFGLLQKSADASVVFTSSSVGRQAKAYWGAYAVSKFATEGMMQVLADELESNTPIRVNSINPGATRTGMRATAYPGEDPMTLPTPDDLMPTYLYLLGPDSRGVTGQAFNAQAA